MNILVIDEEFPFPLNTGKRIRTFNLVRGLSDRNEVSYLAYGAADSPAFRHLQQNGVLPYAVEPPNRRQSGVRFYCRLLWNLVSPYPYIVTSHYSRRFADQLRELLDQHNYDVLVCEWTPYAIYLKELRHIKSVVVAHNIESDIWRRYEEYETNRLKRWYIRKQQAKVARFERECFGWARGATAVSDCDAEHLRRLNLPYEVAVIENGVDPEYYAPGSQAVNPDQIVFTGSMDWRPNQDAVTYFVQDVLPRIRAVFPEAEFAIVGREPPRAIRELTRIEGVTVSGTVDDTRPFVARAAVYVVPLRIGGGSRVKILEAMAMQKAVVSTTIGAEGLRVTDGANILLADTPDAFADHVVRCLPDAELRHRLGDAGRTLVQQHYRWDTLAQRFQSYLESLVQQP